MTVRRRGIDDWAAVQPGDIVSFDTNSPNCPTGGYVHAAHTRDDGKRVLNLHGVSPTTVVEHVSYRLRIEERSVSTRMQEAGGPLEWTYSPGVPLELWSVSTIYDFRGVGPAVTKIEVLRPVRVIARARWNVLRTRDLHDDTDLILEAWSDQPGPTWRLGGLTFPGDRRAWRRYNPAVKALESIPSSEVNCSDVAPIGDFENPHAFASLDANPDALEKLNRVMAWLYDHRYELDDPGQRPRA